MVHISPRHPRNRTSIALLALCVLAGGLAAGLPVASAESQQAGDGLFYSGPVITGPEFCLNRSFGGPVTHPHDSDGDGVADVCSLPRTRRAAAARQNALERLGDEHSQRLGELFAEECSKVPATFGETKAEAEDECAAGALRQTRIGNPQSSDSLFFFGSCDYRAGVLLESEFRRAGDLSPRQRWRRGG